VGQRHSAVRVEQLCVAVDLVRDVRKQDITFTITYRYFVAGRDQIAAFKVAEATHRAEAMLEIAVVDVCEGLPAFIAGNGSERCGAIFGC
jgi:hypothetical protein